MFFVTDPDQRFISNCVSKSLHYTPWSGVTCGCAKWMRLRLVFRDVNCVRRRCNRNIVSIALHVFAIWPRAKCAPRKTMHIAANVHAISIYKTSPFTVRQSFPFMFCIVYHFDQYIMFFQRFDVQIGGAFFSHDSCCHIMLPKFARNLRYGLPYK